MEVNKLTPEQYERLVLLVEEASEVQQNVCKIFRHGYENTNPRAFIDRTNRDQLEREVGDLLYIIELMINKGDLNKERLNFYKQDKARRIKKYLYYNKVD